MHTLNPQPWNVATCIHTYSKFCTYCSYMLVKIHKYVHIYHLYIIHCTVHRWFSENTRDYTRRYIYTYIHKYVRLILQGMYLYAHTIIHTVQLKSNLILAGV